ncbi:HTH-type transcriptional regulator DegA [Pseudobythopirellula maris]|uniref:HTH-type transcriptional regulator DegA n=1 Tax=Pseudobythopirellula maris TaxID=2527991 RepID=A0A5C5ZMI2_9BACT|nr:LacI family DNA-binding transcriptional regulator [Pseudobythopirellula maris]TWT88370.1 HTH-type transcriptional regulator DegA [Pseudobythopirellula maris]
MSVTIYQIAERAGVSSSTVARILRGDANGASRRSIETAERIQKIAQEMGYRANARARAFSRGRTYGIGLLYTDDRWIFEGVNTHVVNSLVRALQGEGYHLVFTPIDSRGAWEDIVLGGQIDGGVVFQPMPTAVADAVRERNLPIVMLGDNSDPDLSQVVVDDFAGAYAATKHFLGLGHRRISCFIHESVKPHSSIQERLRGYRTAMEEAELPVREHVQTPEGEAVDALVLGDERPTAVLCYSDLEATLLAHSLWQYGLSVPGDVSLIGFNDLFSTRYMTPPLTVVGFDAAKIGEWGAKLVLQEIESKSESKSDSPAEATASDKAASVMTVKPKLVVRGSTSAARAASSAVAAPTAERPAASAKGATTRVDAQHPTSQRSEQADKRADRRRGGGADQADATTAGQAPQTGAVTPHSHDANSDANSDAIQS